MNSMLNTGCVDVWLDEIFLENLQSFWRTPWKNTWLCQIRINRLPKVN